MSYSCFISFKHLEANEVYPFLQNLKKTASERLEAVAKENCHYCPFTRNDICIPKDFFEISREKREAAKSWAVQHVFHYRYFYDDELKLLGMYGISTCLTDLFDKTVCFQNSCDQNYERTDWEGVEVFEEIYDKWMKVSDEEVIEKFNSKNKNDNFIEEYGENYKEHLLYYRQTYCYEEIWSRYSNTLYREDDIVYLSLYGFYDIQHLTKFLKMCHERYIEWSKD